MQSYFTFGQSHKHTLTDSSGVKVEFDKDCVVLIETTNDNPQSPRQAMFSLFGPKWSHEYDSVPDLGFYHRGVITIKYIAENCFSILQ